MANTELLGTLRSTAIEKLTEDEAAVLAFLRESAPDLMPAYVANLKAGRQGILNRLAAAFLREDIFEIASRSYDGGLRSRFCTVNGPVVEDHRRPILGALESLSQHRDTLYKIVQLDEQEILLIPIGSTFAFRRMEITGEILHISPRGVRYLEHATELLQMICKHLATAETGIVWKHFAKELQNGSANLALSYTYWNRKRDLLRQLAAAAEARTTIGLVEKCQRLNSAIDPALFFEQMIVEGHHLHPSAKTKLGMTPDAVYHYSSEFDGAPVVRLVGVRRDHAEWRLLYERADPNELIFEVFPEVRNNVVSEFAGRGLNLIDYVLVPVHPWQLEHAIPKIYGRELREEVVVALSAAIPCFATSSFRTVVPAKGRRLAIKLAVNSQMTSTVRSISPQTANNAVVFTRLICQILANEPDLAASFIPIREVAGYCFRLAGEESNPETRTMKRRNLSAVLRENIQCLIAPGELAIVGAALYSESPVSGKSILAELIEEFAWSTNEPSPPIAAERFMEAYAAVVLPGFLTLMVKYGIGLEGHLQNSVPVFKAGIPLRFLFRDWGGIRIHRPRLADVGLAASFYPESITVVDQLAEMHNKVFYTVFQNHLGELILQICKHYSVPEATLWRAVRRTSDRVFAELASDPRYVSRVEVDRAACYAQTMPHKALAKMRLHAQKGEYIYVPVPNPLHGAVRGVDSATSSLKLGGSD